MQVFVFQSATDKNVIGFTAQESGNNLPAEFAPWKLLSRGAMQTDATVPNVAGRNVAGADAVLAGIRRDGYHLVRGKVQLTRRTKTAPG